MEGTDRRAKEPLSVVQILYPGACSLERVILGLAEGCGVSSELAHSLVRVGDPPEYAEGLLRGSLAAVAPGAPPVRVAFTLSQHSSQKEVGALARGVTLGERDLSVHDLVRVKLFSLFPPRPREGGLVPLKWPSCLLGLSLGSSRCVSRPCCV
jgi:hypothetical protein